MIRISLLAAVVLVSSTCSANEAQSKVYSDSGYPYSDLIQKADEVRLFYKSVNESISCRVELSKGEKLWNTPQQKINKKEFSKDPLKACLDRPLAKKILGETFIAP